MTVKEQKMAPTEAENRGPSTDEIRVITISPGVWTYGEESVAERLVLESASAVAEQQESDGAKESSIVELRQSDETGAMAVDISDLG
jgi:hypothetical protein